MPLPTTPEDLFDLLSEDATIAGLLGVYLKPDGETEPAIIVMHGGERIREDWTPGGVEVVIRREATYDPLHLITSEVLRRPTWRIYVTQWEPDASGYALQEVVERIIDLLPGTVVNDVTLAEGLTGLAQSCVRWTNHGASNG